MSKKKRARLLQSDEEATLTGLGMAGHRDRSASCEAEVARKLEEILKLMDMEAYDEEDDDLVRTWWRIVENRW
ncbi:hypothetical protein BBP40_005121 [Aspergillus hancockii]|nr:hypothetical protein BBP40_005121 [Aspergillus hancockii]